MKVQNNVQRGGSVRLAAEDLTGKEGRIVVIDSNGKFALGGANPTGFLYMLTDGGVSGDLVTAEPLIHGMRYRIRGGLANFTLGSRVTSGANGLLALLTLAAGGANLVTLGGVVEEANNIATADTGDVLIMAINQVSIRA